MTLLGHALLSLHHNITIRTGTEPQVGMTPGTEININLNRTLVFGVGVRSWIVTIVSTLQLMSHESNDAEDNKTSEHTGHAVAHRHDDGVTIILVFITDQLLTLPHHCSHIGHSQSGTVLVDSSYLSEKIICQE